MGLNCGVMFMQLETQRKRFFSWLGISCVALAALFTVRAEIAYQNGILTRLTNLPYVTSVVERLPVSPAPVAFQPPALINITEPNLMFWLALASIALCVANVGLATLARRRKEPSYLWAGPLVVSAFVVFHAGRLIWWTEWVRGSTGGGF